MQRNNQYSLLGAIAGDVIGSVFEFNNNKSLDFPLFSKHTDFTDDTVLTIATAKVLLDGGDYTKTYQKSAREYPGRGYGGMFARWMRDDDPKPYNSYGNGSAMRVSPVGFAFNSLSDVLKEAKKSADVTHNHPEGIKGAQATAAAVFMAGNGKSKEEIRNYISTEFGYDLNRTVDGIRPVYQYNETCQRTVPEAIVAFLDSNDFENAIRLAISIGGDSDTLACITGGIAYAFYKIIPDHISENVLKLLPEEFIQIMERFETRYG